VLGSHDLLARVLSFAPTPSDLGRCAAVNKDFRAASAPAGVMLAARTVPAAAALQASGSLELNRDGLGLRIARAFATVPEIYPTTPTAPFPLDDYTILIQLRDVRKGGAVCFSSSGVLTTDVLRMIYPRLGVPQSSNKAGASLRKCQRFDNEVALADDAESDTFWKVIQDRKKRLALFEFCDVCGTATHQRCGGCTGTLTGASSTGTRRLLEVHRMELHVVLVRKGDGAVKQLAHGRAADLEREDFTSKTAADLVHMHDSAAAADSMRCIRFHHNYRADFGFPCASAYDEGGLSFCYDLMADDRDGAPWSHVRLGISEFAETAYQQSADPMKTADHLAHALAMLQPWIKRASLGAGLRGNLIQNIEPQGSRASARDTVLACHALLARVLSFVPTPFDLGRCAAVNKAFHAAFAPAGGMFAARTLPVTAALQASGALELSRDGLGLRISRAFVTCPRPSLITAPFPLDDYTVIIQMRDMQNGGAVCFSSSGVLAVDVLNAKRSLTDGDGDIIEESEDEGDEEGPSQRRFQRFDNEVELAGDAMSDNLWKVCPNNSVFDSTSRSMRGDRLRRHLLRHCSDYLLYTERMELYVVLVRNGDGAVHRLVHKALLVDLEKLGDTEERSIQFGVYRGIDIHFPCATISTKDEYSSGVGIHFPCATIGTKDEYSSGVGFKLSFDLRAEDRNGAPWKYMRLQICEFEDGYMLGQEQDQEPMQDADGLAHALAMLNPWI